KIPVNQITTKPLGGGWYFCEGYYNLVPDESGLFDLWTVAAGFEGSEAFKIQISNFYINDSGIAKRFNNSGS
ncbi:hypothetical protein, partial [Siminovitchia fortis]|uniref:hypothetical protein n=3 Tax=Bacillaceae TaxID=186817 RepID=UPI0011A80292